MGFKEGYSEGIKAAEKVYYLSSEFSDVHDPRLDARLAQAGISQEAILNMRIRLTADAEEIGYTLGALVFFLKHGTIWNPR